MINWLKTLMIATVYIICCFCVRTAPWRYYQINAQYFSAHKGIFSKLALDRLIPPRWRLQQSPLHKNYQPETFPVFLKPEWGSNGQGIQRADNETQFRRLAHELAESDKQYLVQEAAQGRREFEIYTVYDNPEHPRIITVTETVNGTHRFPINSIGSRETTYYDITGQFASEQLTRLAAYKREIGTFGQSRLCVRANSVSELIEGKFHVVELNLFNPMPINLMDRRYSVPRYLRFVGKLSVALALATRDMRDPRFAQPVFTRMMLYNYLNKTARFAGPSHANTQEDSVRRNHQKVHGGL